MSCLVHPQTNAPTSGICEVSHFSTLNRAFSHHVTPMSLLPSVGGCEDMGTQKDRLFSDMRLVQQDLDK